MESEEQEETTADLARVLYETAVLRSGYNLQDSSDFAGRIERMLRLSLGVDLTAEVRGGRREVVWVGGGGREVVWVCWG